MVGEVSSLPMYNALTLRCMVERASGMSVANSSHIWRLRVHGLSGDDSFVLVML